MWEEFFYKASLVKLLLVDRALRDVVEGHLDVGKVAREFGVNLNTVKKVVKQLKDLGYLQTRKRAGTWIDPEISQQKKDLYGYVRTKFQDIVEMALDRGLSPVEVMASLVGAFGDSVLGRGRGKVIFVERNYYNLWTGKVELERELGVHVVPMLLEDGLRCLRGDMGRENLVVTTYYCAPHLEKVCSGYILPLRVTPPLEELVDFSSLPHDSRILVVVLSDRIKEKLKVRYVHLCNKFKGMYFATIQEVLKDTSLLVSVDLLIIPCILYEEYRHLFRSIPRVISCPRFYDDEGIRFIKKYISREN